jgi:Tol biopolymer transport system component
MSSESDQPSVTELLMANGRETGRRSTGGNPAFSKDGKLIFSTGKTSRGALIRFDAKTRQFEPFLTGISANLVSFSKDGQTVAYATYAEGVLWKSAADGTARVRCKQRLYR